MKKVIALLLTILFFSICSITVLGEENITGNKDIYNTAFDLYAAWYENYPDYICGVWTTDGDKSLTFGITDDEAGESGKKEILDLVINDSTVKFVYQKYKYNELQAILNEINTYFNKDVGLVSTGISENENRIEVGVNLKNQTTEMEQFIKMCTEKYGDAVSISHNEIFPSFSVELNKPSSSSFELNKPSSSSFVWIMSIVLVIMLSAVFIFFLRRKNNFIVQTNTGDTIDCHSLTIKDVELMVKETDIAPSSELDKKILSIIEKDNI